MNLKLKGYLLAIASAASYGMNPLFALPLYQDGMDTTSVLFFRYLIAIPLIALMLRARGRSLKLQRAEVKPFLVLGILMAISSITLFQSYNFMAAGIASTILFVYPIMVALIMTLFYKEKLSLQTVLCMLLALVGIALLYKGEDGATLSLAGTLLVLGSSLSYALYIVCNNQATLREVPTLKITLYVLIIALLIFALILLCSGSVTTPRHWYMWGNLVGLAIFPTIISFACTTAAVQCVGSTPTAILGALEPVTAIVFGITVFGETLTPRDCLGLLLIITAVTLVVAGGTVTTYLIRFRKLFPRLPRRKNRT